MANTTVSIRERIKTAEGRWRWSPKVPIPQGKLSPSEAARKGVFYLVWTENGEKQEQPVEERRFEAAVKAARTKERHLEDVADGFNRPDPLKVAERKSIAEAIERRIHSIEISRSADTLKAHRQALRQFEGWSEEHYPHRKYVDEIDHDQVMEFRNWAVKSGNEKKNSKKRGNDLLTANWKAMRVNQFVKVTLGLPHGKGPIKKSDLGKMKPSGPVKIYSKNQLLSFFKVCKPYEDLVYRALYEPAFRKEELMYLEKDDVLVGRQMLRVQSKTRYDDDRNLLYEYKAKADSEREVPISKELMQRIVNHMNNSAHPDSQLVFCTSTGRPDTHLWDKLQTVAQRAGMGGFDLKTFRATRATEWLRPKWLGGFGYDIQTVRDLLGHDQDSESIWSYLRAVKKEELVAEMNKEKEKAASTQPSLPGKGLVLLPPSGSVVISGVQAF
jgi:integrase